MLKNKILLFAPTSANSKLNKRNPGLDILRSLCIFVVVLQHSFLFTDNFYPKFRLLWVINNTGVDFFFILSGFLIGGILEEKYSENNSITLKQVFVFYKRRWYKTLPMYYIVIILCLILSYFNIYYAQDFSVNFLFFLQNITKAEFNFIPQTYSLTIEEWFYLFLPLILLLSTRLQKKYNPFYLLVFILLLVSFIIRFIIHEHGVENWDSEIRKSILSRIDAPIFGVLIYFIHLKMTTFIKSHKNLLLAIGISLYAVCTFFLMNKKSLFFNDVVYYSLVPLSLSLLLPFFYHLRLPYFIEKITLKQSLASYSIYLIHLPCIYIFFKYFKPNSSIESLFLMSNSILLSYLVGMLFYKFIEKPIMNLRDK